MTSTRETAVSPKSRPPVFVANQVDTPERPAFKKAAVHLPNHPLDDGGDTSGDDRLRVDLAAAQREVAQLQRALATSRTIGIAVGILMAQRRVTEKEAFDTLRQASQHRNRKLRDLAADVVFTGALLEAAGEEPTQPVDVTAPAQKT